MSVNSFRTHARGAALTIVVLLPLVAGCREHKQEAPAPNKAAATTPLVGQAPSGEPSKPAKPSGASNRKALHKDPGPVTDKMPLGTPPATELIANPDGTRMVREYYPNGNCYVERQEKQGANGEWMRHGPIAAWHENGVMLQEGEYTDGKMSGHWRYWDDLAQLEREGDYDEGMQEGDWKNLWPGEKLKSAGLMHARMNEGPWKFWHPNGQLMSEGEFVNNKKEGVWTFYLPDGKVDVDNTGTYQDNHKIK